MSLLKGEHKHIFNKYDLTFVDREVKQKDNYFAIEANYILKTINGATVKDLTPQKRKYFYYRITSYNVCYTKLLRISSCKLTKSSRLRAITYFAKFDDTITDEELISAFSGEQYCPTEMSEAEINLKITASSDISFPEHVLYECPEWLFNKIKNQYSDYDLLLNFLNQEAELCFRINPPLIRNNFV